jgi:hypothetical protein
MDGRVVRALCLVAILSIGGCSGLDGGSAETTPAEVTPAGVPAVDDARDLAPGLTERGVVDARALLDAHERFRENRSYTVATNLTERFENGALRRSKGVEARYGPGERTYELAATLAGPALPSVADRTRIWSNGERSARAVTVGGETTVYRVNRSDVDLVDARTRYALATTDTNNLRTLFGSIAGERVRPVDSGNETRYRITADSLDDPPVSAVRPIENVENTTFSAVIEPSGLIRSYRLTYTGTIDGRTVSGVETVRYTNVGATTIVRPEWANRTTSS